MEVIVRVEDGQLRGCLEENVYTGKYYAFRGIPYARPPVGQLRFKDPLPPIPWEGVRDAIEFPGGCAQCDPLTRMVIGTDDCLYLNVFTPSIETGVKMPVMFWIHGGTFRFGSSDDFVYGADYIVRKNVVLVTINHRLGALGYLNVDHKAATGNQGLKDQLMALKWVNRNIEKFGGDPNNVTIFGESSGGASAHLLTLSPLSKGLFHKVICQSGCATNPWSIVENEYKSLGVQLAAILGFESRDPEAIVEFLQSVSIADLIEAQEKLITKMHDDRFIVPFAPTIDTCSANPFLPRDIERLIRRGVDVPFLIGFTNKEGSFFIKRRISMEKPDINDDYYKAMDKSFDKFLHPKELKWLKERGLTADDVKRIYFGDKITSENVGRYVDFMSDMLFIRGTINAVDIQVQNTDKPVYLYEFSYDTGFSIVRHVLSKELQKGATHADELPYLFYMKFIKQLGLEAPKIGSADYQVTEYMSEMWTNFAKTGNPTPKAAKAAPFLWKPVTKGNKYNYVDIGETLRLQSYGKGMERWDWAKKRSKL